MPKVTQAASCRGRIHTRHPARVCVRMEPVRRYLEQPWVSAGMPEA